MPADTMPFTCICCCMLLLLHYVWPAGIHLPAQHVEDASSAADFYANKVLMEWRAKDPNHLTWVQAVKALLAALKVGAAGCSRGRLWADGGAFNQGCRRWRGLLAALKMGAAMCSRASGGRRRSVQLAVQVVVIMAKGGAGGWQGTGGRVLAAD